MANTKSAKKQARQNIKRKQRNLARRSAIKTAIKKMITSLEHEGATAKTQELLVHVESRLARAKSKGVIHANTAARKLSRLAQRFNKVSSQEASA